MTWEEIQKATLDKVFSRTNYGVETPLNAADVADYVKAMPAAANFALIDLAEIMPVYKTVQVEGEAPVHLKEIAPDFLRLDRIYRDNLSAVMDYRLIGDALYLADGEAVTVRYEALPKQVTEDTPGDTTFELSEEAQRAIPLYIASQIFREDDISMSIQYLNEYEDVKAMLRLRMGQLQSGVGFTSVWGWA